VSRPCVECGEGYGRFHCLHFLVMDLHISMVLAHENRDLCVNSRARIRVRGKDGISDREKSPTHMRDGASGRGKGQCARFSTILLQTQCAMFSPFFGAQDREGAYHAFSPRQLTRRV
jgi:hypothetical protein